MAHNASAPPAPLGPGFLTAALLAGGAGSRLGGMDKQAIPCSDGEPLGRRVARHLARRWPSVLVVGRRPELYSGLGLSTTPDLIPGAGVLSGLHTALSLADSPWVYLVACDMPFFDVSVPALLESRIAAAMAGAADPCGSTAAVALAAAVRAVADPGTGFPAAVAAKDPGRPMAWVAVTQAGASRRVGIPAAVTAADPVTGALDTGALTGTATPSACLVRWGRHFEPFHGYWSRALLPRLESLINTCLKGGAAGYDKVPSFRELLAGKPALYISEEEARLFWPDWKPWRNINTHGELAAWRGQSPGGQSRGTVTGDSHDFLEPTRHKRAVNLCPRRALARPPDSSRDRNDRVKSSV